MAPPGFRIRMMEPGEATALFAIAGAAQESLAAAGHPELREAPAPTRDAFVRCLLANEVFVAEDRAAGAPAAFAVAGDLVELYWLAALSVDPPQQKRGLGTALLDAVTQRARWFFHRAVGLSTFVDVTFNAPFYAKRGFLKVPRKDLPLWLEDRLLAEVPRGSDPKDRVVMVKWL